MTEADEVLTKARAREAQRQAAYVPVDYKALNVMVRHQRAALTRAIHTHDRNKILIACRNAVAEWDKPGAMWPDDWSSWQRALDDAFPLFQAPRLEDLR